MKKIGTYTLYGGVLIFASILLYVSINSGRKAELDNSEMNTQIKSSQKNEIQQTKPAEKIQVFLFHGTNRCYSCITAGEYTKKILENNFSQELGSGKIEFREINVDLDENKALANKFRAAGTSFFINSIIDNQDNIKEDTQIWRLVANEESFTDYLVEKLKYAIGEEVSAQETSKINDLVFYLDDNCAACVSIQKYLEKNEVKNKVGFQERNIGKDEIAAEQMAEDAMHCNIEEELFAVPFLRAKDICYVGETAIIKFFDDKLNELS